MNDERAGTEVADGYGHDDRRRSHAVNEDRSETITAAN